MAEKKETLAPEPLAEEIASQEPADVEETSVAAEPEAPIAPYVEKTWSGLQAFECSQCHSTIVGDEQKIKDHIFTNHTIQQSQARVSGLFDTNGRPILVREG